MKKWMCVLIGVMALASNVLADQITNVSASASAYYANSSAYDPIHAVNGDGMLGANNHTNVQDNTMWVAGYSDGAYITVDLGKNYVIPARSSMRVWNYNQIGHTVRGIRTATFWYLADDGGPILTGLTQPAGAFAQVTGATTDSTELGGPTFSEGNGSTTASVANWVHLNTQVTARYLRIKVAGAEGVGTYGTEAFIGLSEIQVYGTLPPPQITNVSASASAYAGNNSLYDPIHAVNGDGMLGANNHTNVQENTMWVAGYSDGAYITVDLEKNYILPKRCAMRVWNYNQTGRTYRGIQTATFWYLGEDRGPVLTGLTQPAGTFTQIAGATTDSTELGGPTFSQGNGSTTASVANWVHLNTPVTARYLRIKDAGAEGVGTYGTDGYIGLSEIKVFGTPEPPRGTVFNFH